MSYFFLQDVSQYKNPKHQILIRKYGAGKPLTKTDIKFFSGCLKGANMTMEQIRYKPQRERWKKLYGTK